MQSTDAFYLNASEPNKSCFLALRSIILNENNNISETLKYGMPCFIFHKKPLCYLWKDKVSEEPYVLFVKGSELSHEALETGSRKKMKILRIDPEQDIPLHTLKEILQTAIKLYN